MNCYLHFGFGTEPRLTLSVTCKVTAVPAHGYTATGYGKRMPSRYMVKHAGRWYRVYIAHFANAASLYIGPAGKWLAVFGGEV